MNTKYTGKQVLEIMKKTFPDSNVDFQSEFFNSDGFTKEELDNLIKQFPIMEGQFREQYTYQAQSYNRTTL